MRAAVICPGPSVLAAWPQEGYDETWAVNRALLRFDADWLSAGDITIYRGVLGHRRPLMGCIYGAANEGAPDEDHTWKGLQQIGWAEIPFIQEHKRLGRALNWSLQAALCHAAQRGYREIDVFGADFSGARYYNGAEGEMLTDDRWMRESEDFLWTCEILGRSDCRIQRIIPHGP